MPPTLSPAPLAQFLSDPSSTTDWTMEDYLQTQQDVDRLVRRIDAGGSLDEALVLSGVRRRDNFLLSMLPQDAIFTKLGAGEFAEKKEVLWHDYMPYVQVMNRLAEYYQWHHPMDCLGSAEKGRVLLRDPVDGKCYGGAQLTYINLGFSAWIVNGIDERFLKEYPVELLNKRSSKINEYPVQEIVYNAVWSLGEYGSEDVLPFFHDRLASTIVSTPNNPAWMFFRSILRDRFPTTGIERLRRHGLDAAALACWSAKHQDSSRNRRNTVMLSPKFNKGFLEIFGSFRYPHQLLVAPPARPNVIRSP